MSRRLSRYMCWRRIPASNTLIVGIETELGSRKLTVVDVNWIAGSAPPSRLHAQVKTRYTAKEALAEIEVLEGKRAEVSFEAPQRDITPGQAAVFYEDDLLLGGGRSYNLRIASI